MTRYIFKNVSRLTFESTTDLDACFVADPSDSARPDRGECLFAQANSGRQLLEADFSVGQHHIEPDDDLTGERSFRHKNDAFSFFAACPSAKTVATKTSSTAKNNLLSSELPS